MRARDWRNKQGYTYGLHGTPTTFTLEERIATLEGGRHCVLVPSGLAAIALVNLALLEQGDEVLLPDNVYGPSRELARTELARWGITHRLYDPMDAAGAGGDDRPAHAAGVAGSRRVGDDGVPRPGRPGGRGAQPRRDDGAGQHLGRRHRLQRLRRSASTS